MLWNLHSVPRKLNVLLSSLCNSLSHGSLGETLLTSKAQDGARVLYRGALSYDENYRNNCEAMITSTAGFDGGHLD